MTERLLVVAIDGPSGVGKGTVARAVAEALGYRHVDTGAMYRAVAWRALRDDVALGDEAALASLAASLGIEASGTRVSVDGTDVTAELRTLEMDRAAATVARVPAVRAALVARQRRLGASGGVVMEGRDIGTVVFPAADVKIFLDATPEERARRRAADTAHGGAQNVATVAAEMATRDRSDRTREVAPLVAAPDAHVIDTTDLSIAQVVATTLAIVRARQAGDA